jgi:hypothetical protein
MLSAYIKVRLEGENEARRIRHRPLSVNMCTQSKPERKFHAPEKFQQEKRENAAKMEKQRN